MKNKKKTFVILLIGGISCILICIFIVLCGKYGYIYLLNNGYIPLTEEYDCRMFMKHYEENETDFELLMKEVDLMNCDIPSQFFDMGCKVRYECNNAEWTIIVLNDEYERVYEDTKLIENLECIEHIEKVFDETLFGVMYENGSGQYIFNVGEYYRIFICGENIWVE